MAGGWFGRDAEFAVLRAALDDAARGRGTVVHVVGEPGIGKTTLCDMAVALAHDNGADVAWGRGVEGAPAFWPWRGVVPTWPDLDGGADRFELFEAVLTELATRADAARSGLLVVLDDLHWADESSLRLLTHVARSAANHAMLVVTTGRGHGARAGDALSAVTADIARAGTVIELHGLDSTAVRGLAAVVTDRAISETAAEAIVERTNGNPFFVDQLLRLVGTRTGDVSVEDAGVPSGVDAVVRERARELGHEASAVLDAASVLGRTFELAALRAVLDDEQDPSTAVAAAVDAGLLTPDESRSDRLRFVHAIVREALHASLPLDRRAALHERAYRHLLATSGGPASILADHAEAAAALLGSAPAIVHGIEAADKAVQAQAYEEALRLVDRALSFEPIGSDHRKLLVLAGMAAFHLGDHPRSTDLLLEAAGLAEAAGDVVAMADAALAVGTGRLVGVVFAPSAPVLRRASEQLGSSHPGVRADLKSRLADFLADADERRSLLTAALDLARQAGDDAVLGRTLSRYLLHGVTWMTLAERLAMVDELRAISHRVGTAEAHLDAECLAVRVLLEAGELAEAERTAVALAADPLARSGSFELRAAPIVSIVVAVARGQLARAESLFAELNEEAQRRGNVAMSEQLASLFLVLEQAKGQGSQLAPMLRGMRSIPEFLPFAATFDVLVAAALATSGDQPAARDAIDTALAHDLDALARDWAGNGVAACGLLADAMWMADHRSSAHRLIPLFDLVADRTLVIGMLPLSVVAWVGLPLGLCALLDDRPEDARVLVREAVRRHRSMGAIPALGRSLLALAEAEVACLDGEAALESAREALSILENLPITAYTDRAARLVADLGGAPKVTSDESVGVTTTFVFTDIVSSTAKAAAAGDDAWIAVLNEHTSTIRALAVRHGGQVVKGLGDGFFVTFSSVTAGARFALDAVASTQGSGLSIRVGIHTGEAQVIDGDHFGHDVNLAARVAGAAGADEVLVSSVVASILGPGPIALGQPRSVELKGIPGTQVLHRLIR